MIEYLIQQFGKELCVFLGLQLLVCLISLGFAGLKFHFEHVYQDKFQHIKIILIHMTVGNLCAIMASVATAVSLPGVLRGMIGGPESLVWMIGIAVAFVGFPGFQYIHSKLTWERIPPQNEGEESEDAVLDRRNNP